MEQKNFSFASRFNKGAQFDIDTTGFEYTKLSNIYNDKKRGGADNIHTFNGCFIFNGKIETAPVFIDSKHKELINIPAHMTDTVRDILNDADAVAAIREGKVGYTIYEYESHGRKCYGINFVDL